jgi:O-antigen ligase
MSKAFLQRIEKGIVLTLLFLLPTQLALHFWPTWAFVYGIRVDLLAPAVYLSDILIVLLFLITILASGKFFFHPLSKYKVSLFLFLTFAIINIIFSVSPPVSIYKWLKVLEFCFLAFYFSRQQLVKLPTIVKTFFYSSIAFSLIGIIQFFKGRTIGGLLYFLGERSFTQSTPGIALVSLNGAEHLRAYSTFSHPNSLAGYLGAVILFILLSGRLKKNIFNYLGVLIILSCFMLSFSLAAFLGIFLVFSFYMFSKTRKLFRTIMIIFFSVSVIGSLLLPIFSPFISKTFPFVGQNISQRLDLGYIAGQMISQKFLIGEGLGTFIINIPDFRGIFSYSWLLQPVHNIFLLILAETGIFGLLAFCFLIYKTLIRQFKNKEIYLLLPLIFILFAGLFDHYTLTLQQNTLLLCVFIGISFNVKMI